MHGHFSETISATQSEPQQAFVRITEGSSLGKSCIMHSSRVGDLNTSLAGVAYSGLTNSGTIPPDAASAGAAAQPTSVVNRPLPTAVF